MQLSYIQPLSWVVPTIPEGYVYHIDFPGPNILSPIFQVTKGLPSDSSGIIFSPGTSSVLGTYGSYEAAQAACETDANATYP